MIKAYLASGWFNENQMRVMNKVRDIILEFSQISLFSPYYDGVVLNAKEDSPEMRRKVFEIDVMGVVKSDLVIAIIDDFDVGAMIECGIAIGAGIPIIAYSDVSGRGLNVMLQQGAYFANGIDELREQLIRFSIGQSLKELPFVKGDFK